MPSTPLPVAQNAARSASCGPAPASARHVALAAEAPAHASSSCRASSACCRCVRPEAAPARCAALRSSFIAAPSRRSTCATSSAGTEGGGVAWPSAVVSSCRSGADVAASCNRRGAAPGRASNASAPSSLRRAAARYRCVARCSAGAASGAVARSSSHSDSWSKTAGAGRPAAPGPSCSSVRKSASRTADEGRCTAEPLLSAAVSCRRSQAARAERRQCAKVFPACDVCSTAV